MPAARVPPPSRYSHVSLFGCSYATSANTNRPRSSALCAARSSGGPVSAHLAALDMLAHGVASAGPLARRLRQDESVVLRRRCSAACVQRARGRGALATRASADGAGVLAKLGRVLKEKAQADIDRIFKVRRCCRFGCARGGGCSGSRFADNPAHALTRHRLPQGTSKTREKLAVVDELLVYWKVRPARIRGLVYSGRSCARTEPRFVAARTLPAARGRG